MIYDRVLDDLGSAVVHGAFGTDPVSIDDLVVRTGASRSIVREAVRVLVGVGLLRARRRVGVVALPAAEWDVLDPRVVGWRLTGPDRQVALHELRALRRAVEPAAAAAAASATGDADGLEALLASADRLAAAAGPDDAATFLQADRDLHRRVLDRSGNALFRRLHGVVERALDERVGIGPDAHDVRLHGALARAVADGDPAAARAAMQEIVDRT
ncbi:FadR/GntR family transcriptional regulator [Curtobacterium sp. SP.BCp]|uniref:FadR/GntR family transcriptional regulator n=1 Tax=Curtobacterium sp. SP.BCp TaxID=3435230 RepID=UPI003F73A99C